MSILNLERPTIQGGMQTFMGDFYTEHLLIHARVTSALQRLSDHLNDSIPTVEVSPVSVTQLRSKTKVDLTGSHAQLNKAQILFVVPIVQPDAPAPSNNLAWRQTVKSVAWAAVGPYSLTGTIHTEAGRDPKIALRMIDKQFLSFTDVTATAQDETTADHRVVIVNRSRVEVLAFR